MRRRTILKLGLGVPATLAVGGAGAFAWWWSTADVDTVGEVPFERRLWIPPEASSTVDADGVRVFSLTAQESTAVLGPTGSARTWAYDGRYLGPTLRAEVGETVRVDVRNELPDPTTVHWHGMHIPARYDGGPHQAIAPGETWSPTWQIRQPPATLWYHPHPHRRTEEQVYRGLAGLFLLDDPAGVPDGLPGRYGVDDVPVVVQDRSFDGRGGLQQGHYGDTILVNGTYGPYLDVTTEAVRLRILNASTARVYDLGLADEREIALVGTDGGLLPGPVRTRHVQLSPGERAEIVVRFRPGERVVLRSEPPAVGMDTFSEPFVGARDRFDVLELRAAEQLEPVPALPGRLADPPDLDPAAATITRAFTLQGGMRINDRRMNMDRIDVAVEVDTTEIWEITNTDGSSYHNFHAHDVQFQVLDVDGRTPNGLLSGWKDTVFVEPDQTVRMLVRFTDYTDPDLPYMYHCHLLQHEDGGMMGQFVVVGPDER